MLGGVLQVVGGGDVVVGGEGLFEVCFDGVILLVGSLVGWVVVYDIVWWQVFVLVVGGFVDCEGSQQIVEGVWVVQGFYEVFNVFIVDEMVQMMQVLCMVEVGQCVMIIYDDFMGWVLFIFGESV